MKVLFYLGHPAHFHLFKNVIFALKQKGHDVSILIKKKDVLEELLRESGLPYLNILPEGRGNSKAAIAWGLLKRDYKIWRRAFGIRPELMIGTSTEITHVGKLLGIPALVVNEDDAEAVPLFSKLGYPWASAILAPNCCRCGKWEYKKVAYPGYHELAYLQPRYFTPDKKLLEGKIPLDRPYFILRFAHLNAHHDSGKSGITQTLARKIIQLLEPCGNVFISAERPLESEFEPFRMPVPPSLMHHVLSFAALYVGDSQTMAAEAAVLGTPSLRFNDFVGKLSYLDELESVYGLTYGIPTSQPDSLLEKLQELLKKQDLSRVWQERRKLMLESTIDLTSFLYWLVENYPNSIAEYHQNPEMVDKFKIRKLKLDPI